MNQITASEVCLAIDATNRWLVAGLVAGDPDTLGNNIRDEAPRESFRRLIPEIQQLLLKSGIERPDWIATTRGPGSFTGTRISVGAARNLAQLWDVPVRSVSSLSLYLYSCAITAREAGESPDQQIAVMIDGKQDRAYAAHSSVSDALAGRPIAITDLAPDQFLTGLYGLYPTAAVFLDDLKSISGYMQESVIVDRQSTWRPVTMPHAAELRDLCLTDSDVPGAVTTSNWAALTPDYLRLDPATSKFNEQQSQAQ